MALHLETTGQTWRQRYAETYRAGDRDYVKKHGSPRQRYPELMRAHDDLRAARERGAATGVPIIRSQIFERDGWLCHLCGEPIDRNQSFPLPRSASLDHVEPLVLGGAHDPANLRAAHLGCNAAKGGRRLVTLGTPSLPAPSSKP